MRTLEHAFLPSFPSSVSPVHMPAGWKTHVTLFPLPFFQGNDPHDLDIIGSWGFIPTVWKEHHALTELGMASDMKAAGYL